MYDQPGLFIGGSRIKGERTAEVLSPVTEKAPEKVTGKVAAASKGNTQKAVDAASLARIVF
ncbi:MAG: hypothetical protein V6Z81_08640 [Parvularculales bacterium]